MAKKNWPDHPAVGLVITVDGHDFKVLDAKAGPMYFNREELSGKDVEIHGMINLLVKPVSGGGRLWLPPIDGKNLCEWAEQKRQGDSNRG